MIVVHSALIGEIPVILTGLSTGEHRLRVQPHGCIGLSYKLRVKITVP